jgi:hypothetical protein
MEVGNDNQERRQRGWNFKRGAKNAIDTETLRERGRKGGKARGRKTGFHDPSVLKRAVEKSIQTRRSKIEERKDRDDS